MLKRDLAKSKVSNSPEEKNQEAIERDKKAAIEGRKNKAIESKAIDFASKMSERVNFNSEPSSVVYRGFDKKSSSSKDWSDEDDSRFFFGFKRR